MRAAIVALVLALCGGVASAYPQFQLSRDQTCTSCHVSPAGGRLLGENGLSSAETMSTWGGPAEAAHGYLVGPTWLVVGGDFRGATGLTDNQGMNPAAFPMQADLAAAVRTRGVTALATVGYASGSVIASHEHWLMWQANADSDHGLYLRAGRFMPVFGLRFAEHNVYTRRFGQTPLYGETYGAAVEYIDPAWEVHVTGFIKDPLQDAVEKGNGGAAYGEWRFLHNASVGLDGRYAKGDADTRIAGGATAKVWLAPVLVEGELQVIRQDFAMGPKRDQIVSYVLGSWFVRDGWLLDVGAGQYNEDLAIKNVDLECVDANLHWFATSHFELLLTNRVQTIAFGSGGGTSGYSLVQVHYRL
ncbi:MAG TPA: hypothetical protein VIV58_37380 [Kofleriaceae bacterium]